MSLVSVETKWLLSMSMLKGIGPVTLKKAIKTSGFYDFDIDALCNALPLFAKALIERSAWDQAQERCEVQVSLAAKHNARIISVLDKDYPALLAETKDDPLILFVKGELAPNPRKSVAIIGTREPTAHGVKVANRITKFFVENEWSVVSGLAIGCDGVAHQAALDANGHTVAVLAHGLQMIAPARHRDLAKAILENGGALVSEYPFGREVISQQYVKRDLTQAGMAQGVVMVQSDVKGGSLHASRAAIEYGRWLAVPDPTIKDRGNIEPKIQANLLLVEGPANEASKLLRCSEDALSQVIVLWNRDHYEKMLERSSDDVLSENHSFDAQDLWSQSPSLVNSTVHVGKSTVDNKNEIAAFEKDLVDVLEQDAVISDSQDKYSVCFNPRESFEEFTLSSIIIYAHELNKIQLARVGLNDFSMLQARMRYLQDKLIELSHLQREMICSSDIKNQFRLRFLVEDVFLHMGFIGQWLTLALTELLNEKKDAIQVVVDHSSISGSVFLDDSSEQLSIEWITFNPVEIENIRVSYSFQKSGSKSAGRGLFSNILSGFNELIEKYVVLSMMGNDS